MASEEVQEEVKGVIEERQVGSGNGTVSTEEAAVTDVQDKEVVEGDAECTEEEEIKQVTTASEDVKQVTAQDSSLPEPDSWEDVEALEERLKTLSTAEEIAAEKAAKEAELQGGAGASSPAGGRQSPQRIVVDGRQGAVPDAVDQVLRLGLTNPRDPGDRLASESPDL
jgi:hypothetical protein